MESVFKIFKKNPNLKLKFFLILPLLSSFLLALTLPKFDISFFAWIALIPLFYFLDGKISKKDLVFGCLSAGFLYALFMLWPATSLNSWWVKSPDVDGFLWSNKEILLKIFIIFFSFYAGSLFFLAFGLLYKKFAKNKLSDALIIPFIWVFLEVLREFLVSGFTWGELGYVLHDNILILQTAYFFGVYGLSFLIVLTNVLLYFGLKTGLNKFKLSEEKLLLIKILKSFNNYFVLTLILVFSTVLLFGSLSIKKEIDGEEKIVAIIHPSLSTVESANFLGHNLYLSIIEEAVENNPDFIILPENSMPWIIIEEENNLPVNYPEGSSLRNKVFEKLSKYSMEQPETAVIIGLHTKIDQNRYNSLVVFKNGKIADIYNKRKTLFMFENVPEFARKKHIAPIEKSKEIDSSGVLVDDLQITALICSEIVFPKLAKQEEADFIVNLSNDSIFDNPLVGKQNHIIAKLRAVENRKYLLRSVKGGISSIIDPYGRVLKQSENNEPQIIYGTINI